METEKLSEQSNETPSQQCTLRGKSCRLKDQGKIVLRCASEYREIVVMTAVQQNGNALAYAPLSLKNDAEIVMAAVQQNGHALRYTSEETLKCNSKDIVMAAVKQNGFALLHASTSL